MGAPRRISFVSMDRIDYPLRGRSRREQRRILKLTRSQSRIEDPEDARLAHQGYKYLLSLRRRHRGLLLIDRFTPWIVTACFAPIVAYTALHSEWTWVAVFTMSIAVSWFAWAVQVSSLAVWSVPPR
jgi:hypothetical protein